MDELQLDGPPCTLTIRAKAAGEFLVFAPRGQTRSVTGRPLNPVTLRPDDIENYRVTSADQGRYGAVMAQWQNTDTGAAVNVKAGSGSLVYTLCRLCPDALSAQAGAQAHLAGLHRGTGTAGLNISGRPEIGAETPLLLSGFREGVDGAGSSPGMDRV